MYTFYSQPGGPRRPDAGRAADEAARDGAGGAVREVGHLALAEELRVDHVRLEHAPLRSLVVQHRGDL